LYLVLLYLVLFFLRRHFEEEIHPGKIKNQIRRERRNGGGI